MRAMSAEERRTFLSHGTRTGHLATVREDGRPHVAPVWFVLDGDDVMFMTGADTVKGRNLRRTGRAALSVDEPTPPYAYVHITGTVELADCGGAAGIAMLFGLRISARYMGDDLAEPYARRNTVAGELLVRLTPAHVVAEADVAG